VSGTDDIGGLIGSFGIIWAYWDHSWLSNSYATGNVDGSSNVGGLVGVNYHCMLSNLYATGNVTGDHNVGGLAGYSHGSVMTSFATGNVEGNYCVGGLVGNNSGTMNNSYANGNVTGDHDVGGLMGTLFDGGVEKSYATGNVTGINYTGGLVGSIIYSGVSTSYATGNVNGTNEIGGLIGYWDLGWLSNSFATGNVNGSNRVGGLVGGNYQGTLSNSYAMGYVTGTDCVGGLVGYNIGMVSDSYATGYVTGTDDQVGGLVGNNGDVVWNCFWDNETSGQSSSFGGTGKTTAEMKTCSTFTDAGWDFRNVWFMVENVTYPVFQWQDIIFPIADAGIDQTVDEGTVVTFDGRGSFDSFGIANYTWRFRDGVRRTVYGVGPTYKFDNPGIFNVELRVTNIFGFWSVDNTTITVIYITPPIADAGPDQIVDEGSLVAFNGSGSTAGAGIVNYTWTFNDGTGGIELYGAAPSHTFNVPGVCAVTLKVTDARGKWDIDTMNVTVKDIRPPVAEAGPDQTVDEGMLVSFNGSGSTGIAGIVNYTWTFYDGIDNIKLYGATPSHIFYARGVYIVTLNVTDAIGHWDMDKMTVTVKEDVTPPVADAGPDRLVDEGTLVTFDGSGSKDNVGIVSYSWKFIDGAPVTLYGVRPEYRFDNPGIFVVRLILTDVAGNRGTDTMTVTVKDTTAPVAEAGPDRTVDGGTEVRFDGRASSDNIGIVDYTWTFVYGPGQIVLHGVLAQFTFVIPGVYSVRLIVSDAAGLRAEDSLLLTVKDVTPPVADAGPDQVVGEKTSVTFEGNGSSDNAGIVNYTWTFEYGAKRIVLYGVSPSFIFIVPGVYYVKLKVSDAAGFWADDAMTLTVKDITPLVANAGRDQTVLVGNTVVLDGSPSTDNGVTERYFWNFTYNGKAQSLEGRTVQFKFDKPGVYVVVLTVVDGAGNRGEDRVVITVEPTVNVLQGLLWMPVLLIAVAGIAGYVVTRKRRAMKGGPSEPPEEPGGTVTAMTAAAGSTPADEVETLQMDDGPQAGAGDPRLEDEATAIASVAEAAALPIAVTPIPMRHVRCLNCRMRIPLYTDGSGVIYCPNCGKTRIYRPKV
jgi:PKD repeat protein